MNRIAHTTLEDGSIISTIYTIGAFPPPSPETRIFYAGGGAEILETYDTPTDAFAGHHRIVAELGAKLLTMPPGVKLVGGSSELRLPRSIVSILRGQ